MQFFLIFLALIFVVCVQILKVGMKKWQSGATGNFRKHSENFVVVAKIDFRYHREISLR